MSIGDWGFIGDWRENQPISSLEVDQRTNRDRNDIGHDHIQAAGCRDDRNVSHNRHQTVGEVETSETRDTCAARRRSFGPGPSFMPEEVVEKGGFNRHCGRQERRGGSPPGQQRHDAELEDKAKDTDGVEAKEPRETHTTECEIRAK
jgi:hypothetical protein